MRVLFWDAFAGISGDMALGSLLALGADAREIERELRSMGLSDFTLEIKTRQVDGIQATDINVVVDEHSHVHGDGNEIAHAHEHEHEHANEHVHVHAHQNRNLSDIEQMIEKGDLSQRAKEYALKVFRTMGEAEARVHGTTIEEVHFHEVGAVDSLVDIVGTAIALDQLGVEKIYVSTLPWSHGFVECAHGTLPLPAPATVALLEGFEFKESGIEGELITPTGAALIRALAEQSGFPRMVLVRSGYGSGKNVYGIPSLLRAVLGEKQ